MRHLLIITSFCTIVLQVQAQQSGSASKKPSKNTKAKSSSTRAVAPTTGTLSTKDRIAMRLKDSAAVETKPEVVETSTVVNGIRVSSQPATEVKNQKTTPARPGTPAGNNPVSNNTQAGINTTGSAGAATTNPAVNNQINANNGTAINGNNSTGAANTNSATTNNSLGTNNSSSTSANNSAGGANTNNAANSQLNSNSSNQVNRNNAGTGITNNAASAYINNTGTSSQTNTNNGAGTNVNANATAGRTSVNNGAAVNRSGNDSLNQMNIISSTDRPGTTIAAKDATIVNKNLVNTTNNGSAALNTNVNNNSNNTTLPVTQINPSTGVVIINNAPAPSRPVTGEQSQYNTSDFNRNQMNAVNQNQNASAVPNQPAATQGQTSNTVGENQWRQNQGGETQWTAPPTTISSGFTRDFPNIRDATWSLDLNKNYGTRYRLNDQWTTSTYNASGVRLETRTEIPVNAALPDAVTTYRGKQTIPVDFTRISRIERPNKPDVYEVRLNTGRVVYLNNIGAEVAF